MRTIIYFEENENQKSIIRFVRGYRRGRWFLREKIWYSYSVVDGLPFVDEETIALVTTKVKKDYPKAVIHCEEYQQFMNKHQLQKFWVIGRWNENGREEFYSGNDQNNKPTYSEDMQEVRMMFAESSAKETLRTIQQTTRDRVFIRTLYLNLVNELLTPVFMITCTSKGSQVTKYFAREEGNRLRLVTTSNAATRFDYEAVMKMFEHLRTTNKNFCYAVLPIFKDNVNSRNIESYMKEKRISRMLIMDLQLKHLNR